MGRVPTSTHRPAHAARRRTLGRWSFGIVAVVALVAGVACAPSVTGPNPNATGPLRYVALGDSYVAGPLLPEPYGDPLDCGRSRTNWPAQVARAIDAQTFVDVSCGSAKSSSMLLEQRAALGSMAPPQFDALTSDTDLVTVSIGGNDVGFDSLAMGCANVLPIPIGDAPWGRPCIQKHVFGSWDKVSDKIARARLRVDAVLAGIRQRAPAARVVVVGYPVAIPDSGVGCWPKLPILDVDVRYLRDKYREMNQMVADAAAAAGMEFVDIYTPSIGHDACQEYPDAWVNIINFDPPGIPLHANIYSHTKTAEVVAAAIAAGP